MPARAYTDRVCLPWRSRQTLRSLFIFIPAMRPSSVSRWIAAGFWPAAIRELTKRINRARYIGVRHGTAVAFVASGFAKHTGRLGVCSARRNRARFT